MAKENILEKRRIKVEKKIWKCVCERDRDRDREKKRERERERDKDFDTFLQF